MIKEAFEAYKEKQTKKNYKALVKEVREAVLKHFEDSGTHPSLRWVVVNQDGRVIAHFCMHDLTREYMDICCEPYIYGSNALFAVPIDEKKGKPYIGDFMFIREFDTHSKARSNSEIKRTAWM